MSYRYSELRSGDVIVGRDLTWRVIRVEHKSRMLEWQIVPSPLDLTPVNPPSVWSPPHCAEEWMFEREGEVRRGRRA